MFCFSSSRKHVFNQVGEIELEFEIAEKAKKPCKFYKMLLLFNSFIFSSVYRMWRKDNPKEVFESYIGPHAWNQLEEAIEGKPAHRTAMVVRSNQE